ncbi:MAG: hypothetical protein J3Q66DRAFT_404518 [Benniella sp.]|nr:MAG: hypothetical protein J3Q66DRAFT_404518 [Benniella sp.]
MLDIPELDDLIFRKLERLDLIQCARVSKKWHALVSPHLWHDLSWACTYARRSDIIRKMVLEDYLAEQRYQESQNDGSVEELLTQVRPSPPLSALSKYGQWIRKLPDLYCLCCASECRFQIGSDPSPTIEELILHLLKRCSPDVQVNVFDMNTKDMDLEPENLRKSIVEFTIPRVQRLHMSFDRLSPPSELLKLMELLDQCTVMETLELGVNITFLGTMDTKDKQMESEPKSWTSFKELTLFQCNYNTDTDGFWLWLLRRCSRGERMRINKFSGAVQDLYKAFSGSRNGWKTVRLESSRNVGSALMDALAKHFPTLEEMDFFIRDETFSRHLVQVMGSCPNLRNLASMDFVSCWFCFVLDAETFIDLDPDTGLLKPWACEGSLKGLMVMVVGIPRPDLKGDDVIEETYPGQGREIQSRVYDRLARLTNLETLWLGDDCDNRGDQSLEMTLESGLGKLSGLKNLKELSVNENWPILYAVWGSDEDGIDGEAALWMKKNCPNITALTDPWIHGRLQNCSMATSKGRTLGVQNITTAWISGPDSMMYGQHGPA